MAPASTIRIELKLSGFTRFLAFMALGISAYFVLGGVSVLLGSDLPDGEWIPMLVATVFFAWCGWLALKRLTSKAGWMELRPDGLAVCAYMLGPYSGVLGGSVVRGYAPWDEVLRVNRRRVWGVLALGVRIRNVQAFLDAGERLAGPEDIAGGFRNSLVWIVKEGPQAKIIGPILGVLGMGKLPDPNNPVERLEWNANRYGYQVMIAAYFLDAPIERVIEQIQERIPDA